MDSYLVEIREVWVQTIRVENCNNKEEAIKRASVRDGDEVNFEYSHDLDSDNWIIEKE